jgi:hypothetical protein
MTRNRNDAGYLVVLRKASHRGIGLRTSAETGRRTDDVELRGALSAGEMGLVRLAAPEEPCSGRAPEGCATFAAGTLDGCATGTLAGRGSVFHGLGSPYRLKTRNTMKMMMALVPSAKQRRRRRALSISMTVPKAYPAVITPSQGSMV